MTAVNANGGAKVNTTSVECPTCGAWVGWACSGRNYGYHAAGYHRAREKVAAARAATLNTTNVTSKR